LFFIIIIITIFLSLERITPSKMNRGPPGKGPPPRQHSDFRVGPPINPKQPLGKPKKEDPWAIDPEVEEIPTIDLAAAQKEYQKVFGSNAPKKSAYQKYIEEEEAKKKVC
jgi:1-acyl-sn-glycerol-3-phosphate acyltransferase